MHYARLRFWALVLCLTPLLLLSGPSRAQASDKAREAEIRADAWSRMRAVFKRYGIHEARGRHARPGGTHLSGTFGAPAPARARRVPEVSSGSRDPGKTIEFGRPSGVTLGLTYKSGRKYYIQDPKPLSENESGSTYRVLDNPNAPSAKGERYRTERTKGVRKPTEFHRDYLGVRGLVRRMQEHGPQPVDAVGAVRTAGGYDFVYRSVRPETRLESLVIQAQLRAHDGWILLRLSYGTAVEPHRAWMSTEPALHKLMTDFVREVQSVPQIEVGPVRILDANPIYTAGRRVEDLASPEDLYTSVTQERKAVAADGVTQVVLEVALDKPGVLRLAVPEATAPALDQGRVEMLFGGRSASVEDGNEKRHVAYALYTPPTSFAEFSRRVKAVGMLRFERFEGGPAMRTVPLIASTGPVGKDLQEAPQPIEVPLVRPPVLLVHGTFDNPEECWEADARELEPTKGTTSMAAALRHVGYQVFKVDFSKTNGRVNAEKSSFRHNARVLWENPQGLYAALEVYRDELGIAVTQADVVGHSLGGLIARLWASDEYNPASAAADKLFDREGSVGYRRPGNFGQGDIHRLITIGTPHMGSDLAHLGIALQDAPTGTRATLRGLLKNLPRRVRKAGETVALWALGASTGYGVTPLVRNQRPHLPGMHNIWLKNIGPTRVPSHAVVCAATMPDLSTFDGTYHLVLRFAAYYMLNVRPEIVKQGFARRGQAGDLDRLYGEVRDLDRRAREIGQPVGAWLVDFLHPIRPRDNLTLAVLARAILFGNTQGDMVVRVESQAGGLPLQHTTFVNGVLHSFATRYERVQRAVVTALTGPTWRFAPEGFPTPPPMRNIQPFEVKQDPAVRAEAIDKSNLVPSHAQSLSYVANKENVVIIMRPVNEHATALIANNLATKDMHVKGKSASWGPQRGLIPVEQRFSKLHFLESSKRAKAIEKFDGKVQECLRDARARETALQVSVDGTQYDVLVVEGDDLEPPQSIVLKPAAGEGYKGWESGGVMAFDPEGALPAPRLSPEEIERRGTRPFMVLSDRHTRVPLTADYDILAFGPSFKPGETSSDPEMGFVIDWQKKLIAVMNNEIRLRGNYTGGNVSHHGPETQFVYSEGADYPNSVFEPDGDIWIIEEGPPGKRDLHMKCYFHQMRSQGWHLDPNPHTWNWGDYDPKRWPASGWRPEDGPPVSAAVIAEDNPFDSDEGGEPHALPAKAGGR